MRLFVGCALPGWAAAALAAWGRELAGPGERPLPEASLHVTLFFLGERDEASLPELRAAVRALPGAGVPLVTAGVARLGRVLAIDLEDPSGALRALHACGFPGWEPDHRRFRPHVTVARTRSPVAPLPVLPSAPALAFESPAVTLFRSHPGSRYEALERRALG